MDYLFLQDFLVSYSLPTLAIACITCIVRLLLKKFFCSLPNLAKSYIPFLLAIILYFGYDMIFVTKSVSFSKGALYGGVLSGSLSVIFYSTITKISKGKPISANTTILLIEGILNGYIAQDLLTKTAVQIEQVLSGDDSTIFEQQVIDTITYNSSDLTSADIVHLAKLIIAGVKSIKKT